MSWIIIALCAPALWSASNHIDKYLLERHFGQRSAGALYLFGVFTSLVAVIISLALNPAALQVPIEKAAVLMVGSMLGSAALFFYLKALRLGEVSAITPIFQSIPIFYLGLAYVAFNETLSRFQLAGSALVLVGAVVLSLEFLERGVRLKPAAVVWMLGSSLFMALNGLAFKWVGVGDGFLSAVFWEYLGSLIVCIGLLLLAKPVRTDFLATIKEGRPGRIALLVGNEAITAIADLCIRFAGLLAPLALVQVVNGLQPVFAFGYGVLLALFWPRVSKESLLRRHILQKCGAIAVIFVGTLLLNR